MQTEENISKVFLNYFSKLGYDTTYTKCRDIISSIINDFVKSKKYKNKQNQRCIMDIFRIWAYKRDCHNFGEGLRDISYYILISLYDYYPKTVCLILKNGLYGKYGYWKDYVSIIKKIHEIAIELNMTDKEKYKKYDCLVSSCREAMLKQRSDDIKEMNTWFKTVSTKKINQYNLNEFRELVNNTFDKTKTNISLVSKYLVNEKSTDNNKAYWYIGDYNNPVVIKHVAYFVRALLKSYNDNGELENYNKKIIPYNVYKSYRQYNTKLRCLINVLEQLLCSKQWSVINPNDIPNIAKYKIRKALLNEKLSENPTTEELLTGNRFPDNNDRVKCRTNMNTYMNSYKNVDSNNSKNIDEYFEPLYSVLSKSDEGVFRYNK